MNYLDLSSLFHGTKTITHLKAFVVLETHQALYPGTRFISFNKGKDFYTGIFTGIH